MVQLQRRVETNPAGIETSKNRWRTQSDGSAERQRASAGAKMIVGMATSHCEVFDRIPKQLQAIALGLQPVSGPVGVLGRQDVSLGVGHEAQDLPAGIADARDVVLRSIRIVGIPGRRSIRVGVTQDDLIRLPQPLQYPFLPAGEVSLAVRDGHVQPLDPLQKCRLCRSDLHIHPPVGELPRDVVRQGGQRAFVVRLDQKSRFEQHLEPVADAEDEFARVAELADRIGEEMLELAREDFPGRDIVAVAEPARQDQDLRLLEAGRIFAESVDVDAFRDGPRGFEGERGLRIAIGAGRPEDQGFR